MMERIALFLLLIVSFYSCKKDKTFGTDLTYTCSKLQVSYQTDIAPLISQSCATNQGPGTGCHDAWIFEYENLRAVAENGTLKAVCVDSKQMPIIPNNFGILPLTSEEIQVISCWIYDGAPNN